MPLSASNRNTSEVQALLGFLGNRLAKRKKKVPKTNIIRVVNFSAAVSYENSPL
jgi:hypothetical protein